MMRLLLSLLLLTGSAWGTSITIGELKYLSNNQSGDSFYQVVLNDLIVTGVTTQQLTFLNASLSVGGMRESTGPTSTPSTFLFEGGPGLGLAACPCTSLRLQLVSPGNMPFTFTLANGQSFTTSAVNVTVLLPASGRFLQPGAQALITLTAVPEPGTWALMITGLIALWVYSGRLARTRDHLSTFRLRALGPEGRSAID